MNEGRVTVREQWTFAEAPTSLSRTVYLDPWVGSFPLRQRLVDLVAPEHRRLNYGFDRTYLKFTPARTLILEYQILGLIESDGTADLTLRFYEMPEIERLSVSFPQGQAWNFVYDAAFEKNLFGPDGGAVARGVPAGRNVRIKLSDSNAAPSSAGFQEYLRQLGPALGLGALGLLVGLSLRTAPPRLVILWARIWNVLLVLVVLGLMAPMVVFDLISPQYRGLPWIVNLLSILVVYLGLLGAFGAFVRLQERMLKEGQPTAYYLQFSLPAMTLLLLPAGLVQPAFWLLPAAALLGLVCWSEKRLALYLGAANHLLLESITAKGEISLKDLAKDFELPEERLLKLLQGENAVVDHDRGVALSPATASHRQNLAICPACGGGTEVKGQMALVCPFCDREYAATRDALLPRPVPVVVQAQASAFSVLGVAVLVWTGMMVLVGFLDETLKEGVSVAIFYSGAVALAGGLVGGRPDAVEHHVARWFGWLDSALDHWPLDPESPANPSSEDSFSRASQPRGGDRDLRRRAGRTVGMQPL